MRDSAMLKAKPCCEAEGNRTNQVGLMKPDRALALPAFDKNENVPREARTGTTGRLRHMKLLP